MPFRSKAQERLMEAAAHTKGGFGGVSQSVGKKFAADAGPAPKNLPEKVDQKASIRKDIKSAMKGR